MLKKDINKGVISIAQVSDYEITDIQKLCGNDNLELRNRNYRQTLHQLQFICSRLSLQSILNEHFQRSYSGLAFSNKKPCLNNGLYVSISHSNELVAVAVSEEVIGIDIQQIQPKIEHIAPRVFNERELKLADNNLKRTIIWSAKEAMYKYAPIDGLDFSEHLLIENIIPNDNNFKLNGKLFVKNKEENINLEGTIINDYVLVYTS